MRILTIADPEAGVKPTRYMTVIGDESDEKITELVSGVLKTEYGIDSEVPLDKDFLWNLRHCGYSWLDMRFCVEITEVSK